MYAAFGGGDSGFGATGETGSFGGEAGLGGAGAFVSVDDAAMFGAAVTAFSSDFSVTGGFDCRGIEVRSGTSTRAGKGGVGSVRGFSFSGVADFAGGQLATPPSCTVPHQGQKVISFFCVGGGALAATGCTGVGLTGASAGFSITAGFSMTTGFSTVTVCGFGGATDTSGCGACS